VSGLVSRDSYICLVLSVCICWYSDWRTNEVLKFLLNHEEVEINNTLRTTSLLYATFRDWLWSDFNFLLITLCRQPLKRFSTIWEVHQRDTYSFLVFSSHDCGWKVEWKSEVCGCKLDELYCGRRYQKIMLLDIPLLGTSVGGALGTDLSLNTWN
jgi:hypothetical protein